MNCYNICSVQLRKTDAMAYALSAFYRAETFTKLEHSVRDAFVFYLVLNYLFGLVGTGALSVTFQSEIYLNRSLYNFLTFVIKYHTCARDLLQVNTETTWSKAHSASAFKYNYMSDARTECCENELLNSGRCLSQLTNTLFLLDKT
jgi:hypothetical protein